MATISRFLPQYVHPTTTHFENSKTHRLDLISPKTNGLLFGKNDQTQNLLNALVLAVQQLNTVIAQPPVELTTFVTKAKSARNELVSLVTCLNSIISVNLDSTQKIDELNESSLPHTPNVVLSLQSNPISPPHSRHVPHLQASQQNIPLTPPSHPTIPLSEYGSYSAPPPYQIRDSHPTIGTLSYPGDVMDTFDYFEEDETANTAIEVATGILSSPSNSPQPYDNSVRHSTTQGYSLSDTENIFHNSYDAFSTISDPGESTELRSRSIEKYPSHFDAFTNSFSLFHNSGPFSTSFDNLARQTSIPLLPSSSQSTPMGNDTVSVSSDGNALYNRSISNNNHTHRSNTLSQSRSLTQESEYLETPENRTRSDSDSMFFTPVNSLVNKTTPQTRFGNNTHTRHSRTPPPHRAGGVTLVPRTQVRMSTPGAPPVNISGNSSVVHTILMTQHNGHHKYPPTDDIHHIIANKNKTRAATSWSAIAKEKSVPVRQKDTLQNKKRLRSSSDATNPRKLNTAKPKNVNVDKLRPPDPRTPQRSRRHEGSSSSSSSSTTSQPANTLPRTRVTVQPRSASETRKNNGRRSKVSRSKNATSTGNGTRRRTKRTTANKAAQARAEERQRMELDADRRRVFVSNIPSNACDDDIRGIFCDCGTITNTVWFPSRTDGRFYGSGLITFATTEGAEKAIELNQTMVLNRTIRVEFSSCQDPVLSCWHSKEKPPGCRTMYLNNVPDKSDEERVRQVFSHCGKIKRVRFHERDGTRTGGAFVEFFDTDATDLALEMHGSIVDGHPLYVDYQRY